MTWPEAFVLAVVVIAFASLLGWVFWLLANAEEPEPTPWHDIWPWIERSRDDVENGRTVSKKEADDEIDW